MATPFETTRTPAASLSTASPGIGNPRIGGLRIGDRMSRLPRVLATLLFAFYAAVILLHATPPLLGDMGNWIYSGMLLARHLHGLSDTFHVLKHYPVPNSTLTVALGLLCAVLPWNVALKVFLLFYLALCFAAVATLARATNASPLLWLIAPSGFLLAVNFWYGFLAFQLGIALLFLFVALLLNRTLKDDLSNIPIGILLTLLFFTHMVPFTFACLLLLFFSLQTARFRILLQAILPALLVASYILGRLREGPSEGAVAPTVSPHLFAAGFWAYKANTFFKSFGFVNPVVGTDGHSVASALFGRSVFLALFAVSIVVCAALAVIFLRGIKLQQPVGRLAFLWLAIAISLPVYLLSPKSLLGISDPGSRILQTVLWIALFACLRSAPADRIAAAGSAILAVAGAALFATVTWMRPINPAPRLPDPIERLANAPYDYSSNYYGALARSQLNYQVFTTGIFINQGALPTNPP